MSAEVFQVKGGGHQGSRSTGKGWYARLPDGHYLRESQSVPGHPWPPYPVIAVIPEDRRPVKTKREALSLVERFNPERLPDR